MEKIMLNTDIVKDIFSGTYYTIWDIEPMGEWTEYYQTKDILQGYEDYSDTILDGLQDAMGQDNILDIEIISVYSPRYYNFRTDTIDFELTVKDGFITELFNKLKKDKEFKQYLHDHYTSCDGFISFTPNNIPELGDQLKGKGDEYNQSIGAMFNYCIDQARDIHDWTIEMKIYEEISGNGYQTIKCSKCDSENLKWEYNDKWEGYLCEDCKNKMKTYY